MKISLRVWILIATLIASALIIAPSFEKGVIIKQVEQNSTASESGLASGTIIKFVNN